MHPSGATDCEVCIVGLGPAGMAAALTLSASPLAPSVLCLEAGLDVASRVCAVRRGGQCGAQQPCAVISGVGGCSLLGGGKVSMFPAGRGLSRLFGGERDVERWLRGAFDLLSSYLPLAPPAVPHSQVSRGRRWFSDLGFQYRHYEAYAATRGDLRRAYQQMLAEVRGAGVGVVLGAMVTQVHPSPSGFELVATQGARQISVRARSLVLAVGRLGWRLLDQVNRQCDLAGSANFADVGVRLEFPTHLYGGIDRYHKDLKLLFGNARTFCVCKGGRVAVYFLDGVLYTEGCDDAERPSGFTNLSIRVRTPRGVDCHRIRQEIATRQLRLTGGKPVRQILDDYLDGVRRPGGTRGEATMSCWSWGDVAECFPEPTSSQIKAAVRYFTSKLLPSGSGALVSVFAPELDYGRRRFSVRSDFSIARGLYLVGDCTGMFRGTLQAFCSGMACAESVLAAYDERSP